MNTLNKKRIEDVAIKFVADALGRGVTIPQEGLKELLASWESTDKSFVLYYLVEMTREVKKQARKVKILAKVGKEVVGE